MSSMKLGMCAAAPSSLKGLSLIVRDARQPGPWTILSRVLAAKVAGESKAAGERFVGSRQSLRAVAAKRHLRIRVLMRATRIRRAVATLCTAKSPLTAAVLVAAAEAAVAAVAAAEVVPTLSSWAA